MLNPTWLYTGAVYAGAVWLARRGGIDLPRRMATFFYALVLVFFFPVLTQDKVNTSVDFLGTLPPWEYTVPESFHAGNVQLNDLALQIVPWAHQVREGWRSLHAPLWNQFSGAGYPLLASAQSSALSPLRILGLPLSLAHALSFEAAMKVLIALTFTFLWCRRRGYSELASATGAVAFGFSTFTIVWLHFPLITTACLVPAVFYVLDLLAERVTYARFVSLSVVGAIMLFGGHPETVSHTAFLAALYVLWIAPSVGRGFSPTPPETGGLKPRPKFLLAILGAAVVTILLAAPFLAPFAEAVKKSKRYQELETRTEAVAVPYSDWPSAILLFSPQFHGAMPREGWGPAHAESISGFAGILGIAAWLATLVHVIRTRRWRSHEAFFVLAAVVAVAVIFDWPGIGDLFHVVFHLAANARVRLLLVLLLAVLTACAVDLLARDRMSAFAGIGGAGALLLAAYFTSNFWTPHQRETAILAMVPSAIVLAVAALPIPRMLLLVAVVAELWIPTRDWNPVVSADWMYPKTPMLRALDDLTKDVPKNAPFRIVGNAATLFPNVSAVYGYEDVRAHDPMSNGRYIGLLSHVVEYDPTEYFARWPDWEHPLLDYLNVRYVLTSAGGELPPRFQMRYDGADGRIFENTAVLPRFFAVTNVVIDFRDASFANRLKAHRDWSQTALLESLAVESPPQRDDFFKPRPADAPLATVEIREAGPADYRLSVRAPRWSLVASSIPWWPGWKVERNGARVQPIRVNGAFLGFAVPPGQLDVRVWYDPWTFRFGAILAVATLVALVAYGVRRRS
ncbi:MAG TPA: YfhO family protein [Thermoanaerobaculia bacterium]|nr:YfhO family protein [Thermoanaerobaculia bacterium]